MKIDRDFALFYGILMGDGCIGKYGYKNRKNKYNYNISINCNAIDDVPFFDNIVGPLLLSITGRKVNYRYRKDCNCIAYNFSNKEFFFKLKKIGFPTGKKGTRIRIPQIFYKRKLIKYVMQGLFATDGSLVLTKNPNKYYSRLEFHAICKDLIKEMHIYLSSLGLNGSFYLCKRTPDPRWKKENPRYRFQFNGKDNSILFENLVGFVNPKQQRRFDGFIEYSEKYITKNRNEHNEEFYKLLMPRKGFEPSITSS
jgi:hypothetical protein